MYKITRSIFGLLITVSFLMSAVPSAQAASPKPFDLQVGPVGFSYYTPEVPFKDLMFQSLGWTSSGSGCVDFPKDVDGYPIPINPACRYGNVLALHIATPPPGVYYRYPPGHYVLTYQGSGTITVGWDAINQVNIAPGRIEFDVTTPTSSGIRLTLTATDPANHVRDIHVFLASDESTYQTQPFRQAFLDVLAPFQILRMVGWSGVVTNIIADNGNAYWTNATSTDAYTVVLPKTASSVDNAYKDMVFSGLDGLVFINSYEGATRTLHLASPVKKIGTGAVRIYDFANRTWDKRTSTSNQAQTGVAGIAYEYQVALANITGKDLWINVPTAADDNFVTQLATFLKNNLNPNLKIYIEYSNETWNYVYPGYRYSWAMVQKMGITGSTIFVGGDQWQAYRALEIFHLFNRVFGYQDLRADRVGTNDRLVRMITSHTSWTDRAKKVMDWQNTGNSAPTYGRPAYEYADAFAATNYWTIPSWITADISTLTIDQLIQYQKESINELAATSSPTGKNSLYLLAQAAQARNIKLIQYEGGGHFDVPSGDQATIDKLTSMNRDPRMRDVYGETLRQWIRLSQEFPGTIGNWAHSADIFPPSRSGFWGLLESVFQNPSTVPRYQGVLDYVNGALYGAIAPSTPASLTAIPVSSSQIDLAWNATAGNVGVTNYTVYRNNTQIASVANTFYSDTGLAPGTTYTYYIRAVDAAGNVSSSSASISVVTKNVSGAAGGGTDVTPPSAPGNLTGSAFSATQVRLTWDAPADVNDTSGYRIKRGEALLTYVTTLFFEESGLTPNTTYVYTVEAIDEAGNSSSPSSISLTTPVSKTQTATITPPTPTPLPPSTTTYQPVQGPFGIGYHGDQVKLLQEMLAKEGFFTGEITGYYGPLTQRAVETFQIKYNLVTQGSPSTTGFGLAGPGTRAKLNSLYAGGSAGGMTTSTDRDALIASLRKQVEELTKIVAQLIAQLQTELAKKGR